MQKGTSTVFEVPECSSDTISSISIQGNRVCAASWAADVRLWELQPPSTAIARAMQSAPAPVLSTAFNSDASSVFFGAADNVVREWNVGANAVQEIGRHNAPVKETAWMPSCNMIVTASWDKTIKWWDTRKPDKLALSVNLPERAYAMDTFDNFVLVGCADRKIVLYDVANPSNPLMSLESTLKLETRCVSIFPDKAGFAVGSSEGRCSIQHFEQKNLSKNFSFKCHRDAGTRGFAYPVNAVSFHSRYGTLATAGGDGQYNFWDKDARHRLKLAPKRNMPITAGKFSPDGSLYVFAIGYDWSKGMEEYEKNIKNQPSKAPKLYVDVVQDSEVLPKNRSS
jgi:mRNA export factor